VQGHNSPLPKTLLTKISTLTMIWSSQSLSLAVWMVPWQREEEEDVADSDKRERENRSEQIDSGEDGGGWGWVCEADGGWGEIEKTRREDEDERRFNWKINYVPILYWKLLKCPWWHLCCMFRLSGQQKWTTWINFVNDGKM